MPKIAKTKPLTRAALGLPPQGAAIRGACRTTAPRASGLTSMSMLCSVHQNPPPAAPAPDLSTTAGQQKTYLIEYYNTCLTRHLSKKNDDAYPNRGLSRKCIRCPGKTVFVATTIGAGKAVAFPDDDGFDRLGMQQLVCVPCKNNTPIDSGFSAEELAADDTVMNLLQCREQVRETDAGKYHNKPFPIPPPRPYAATAPNHPPRAPSPVQPAVQPPLPAFRAPLPFPLPFPGDNLLELALDVHERGARPRVPPPVNTEVVVVSDDEDDIREFSIVAWMANGEDPKLVVIQLDGKFLNLSRYRCELGEAGIEKIGHFLCCTPRKEWVRMPWDRDHWAGESSAILICAEGVTEMLSLDFYMEAFLNV